MWVHLILTVVILILMLVILCFKADRNYWENQASIARKELDDFKEKIEANIIYQAYQNAYTRMAHEADKLELMLRNKEHGKK